MHTVMTEIDEMLKRAKAICKRDKIHLKTLSYRLAGDSKFFARLEQGRDVTLSRYKSILEKLDDAENAEQSA